MATVRKTFAIPAAPDAVWDAFADIGAVHTRQAPGFVTDTRLDGPDRIVTFANGMVLREVIITLDHDARRIVYSARGGSLTHHNAAFQVEAGPSGGSVIHWTTDLLPDAAAETVSGMMEAGSAAMIRAWTPA